MSLRLAVLVSGRGSNLRAIVEAIDAGRCRARVSAVLADRACDALGLASEHDIPTEIVSPKSYADRPAWDAGLAEALARTEPEWIVLAGFMRIVGPAVLARFGGRIVNVHPSLLPAFPGLRAPAQAIAAGVRVSGCTVHLVDEGVDTGAILAQAALPVRADDDAASLHGRIQTLEHRLLPEVLDAIATGRLEVGETIRWREPTGGALLGEWREDDG